MIRVLYVDDEEGLLDVCKAFLDRSDELTVDIAISAKEAQRMIAAGHYDAIISDYQMPGTNGIQFLKEIRSRADMIPFILFTGRGREEVVIEALNSGADFYIQKGGDPTSQFMELEHKVKEAVRRNRAEKGLKLNEERLTKAQSIGQTGCWEFILDGVNSHLWGSEEGFRLFGIPISADGAISQARIEDCIVEKDFAHRALMDLVTKGSPYDIEYHVIPEDGGRMRTVRSVAELERNAEGDPVKVVGVVQDITERKRAEAGLQRLNRELLAIKECNKAMVRAKSEQELLNAICHIVCDVAGYRLAWIGMAQNDEARSIVPMAWSGFFDEYVKDIRATWADDDCGRGPTGMAIKTRRTAFIQDFENDSRTGPWHESAKSNNLRSSIAIPLLDGRRAFGAITLYSDQTYGFNLDEVNLLEEMAGDLSFGILGLRALESRVKAEEALRLSEERFRTLFEEAPMAISISSDMRRRTCNRRFVAMFGYDDIADVSDKPLIELVAHAARPGILSIMKGLTPGEPFEGETTGLRRDGSEFPLHSIFTKVRIADQEAFLGFYTDMTERERMETMMIESEEKYRTYIERSPLAFALTDQEGQYIDTNQAFCGMLGCKYEDIIGRRPDDLLLPEDDAPRPRIVPFHDNGSYWEGRVRRMDDSTVPISMFTVKLPGGNTMAFMEDISERKGWERMLCDRQEEVLQSEAKFHAIFDRAALGITTTDMNGKAVDFNEKFVELVGHPAEDIRSMHFSDYTHPEDVGRNIELFKSLRNGTIDRYDMEKRYVRKDGSVVWVHLFTSKLGHSGSPDMVLTLVEDINERKNIERSLREGEEAYSKLISTIPDIVLRMDMNGTIDLVNAPTLVLSGYSKEEVIGKNIFSFLAPEDVEKAIINNTRMVQGLLGPIEYGLVMKDGRKVLIEANGDVLRNAEGIPTGIVLVSRDLTERRQLEEKLKEANRRLRVLDNITRHDTLNKLMALQGFIELDKTSSNDPKHLRRIDSMERIVRFLHEQMNIRMEYQNIGIARPEWQSVRGICERAASEAHLGKIDLSVDGEDVQILADVMMFKVFYNLIDNSLKHGKKVSGITVTFEHPGDDLRIVLCDDGVGISQEDKVRLFEEGYGRDHGLGLFLSKEILEITGITIKETGLPGNGARFEIIVPAGKHRPLA